MLAARANPFHAPYRNKPQRAFRVAQNVAQVMVELRELKADIHDLTRSLDHSIDGRYVGFGVMNSGQIVVYGAVVTKRRPRVFPSVSSLYYDTKYIIDRIVSALCSWLLPSPLPLLRDFALSAHAQPRA